MEVIAIIKSTKKIVESEQECKLQMAHEKVKALSHFALEWHKQNLKFNLEQQDLFRGQIERVYESVMITKEGYDVN